MAQMTVINPHTGERRSVPLQPGMEAMPPEQVAEIVKQTGMPTVAPTRENPAKPDEPLTGLRGKDVSVRGTFMRSLGSLGKAIEERTTDPVKEILDPKSGIADRALAGMQIAGTVLGAPFALAGASAQAAAEASGMSEGASRILGAVVEIGSGLWGMVRASGQATKAAKELIRAGGRAPRSAAAVQQGFTRAEQVGSELQTALRGEFRALNKQFGDAFNVAERNIIAHVPELQPGTPAWHEAGQILNYAEDAAASAGPKADRLLAEIRTAMRPGKEKPISMDTLIKLRKVLHERAGVGMAFDPDASVVGKKAAEMRDTVMDVIRGGADPNDAMRYDELRNAVRTQLYDPERFLASVVDDATTPMGAFKALFIAKNDPHIMRTAGSVLRSSPANAGKLRMGFAESFSDILSNPEASKTALARLEAFKPTVEALGLYTPAEMADLKFLFEKNLIPSLVSELTSNARASQVLLRGALGAQVATHLASHPATLAVSALAFGGIPQLRRAAMLPAGSKAMKAALAIGIRNIARGLSTLNEPANGSKTKPQPAS